MPRTEVTVHVNRGNADALEPAAGTLETDGSVALRLQGHVSPAHVHCRLDGDLERIASIEQSNYYVEPDAVTTVPVVVDADTIDQPIDGRLEVVTGYGSESVTIDVTVVPGPPAVDIDDSLSEPTRREPDSTALEDAIDQFTAVSGLEPASLAVVALGVVAIVIATTTAATIASPIATAGLGIVVVGVVVAFLLLVW
ncbi:DUF7524 family protein [Natrinema halophilum]|uniref:Uncharacterized protein n=1 Tax=Natrinema halophilum TaxID=1699371 RepID=A0A7D5KB12_9EURY|nr:hypothetical protein [Natrinema halophilum]QLG47381.1 hypothetical protein HYG82_00240 [Natrinema halophilum]